MLRDSVARKGWRPLTLSGLIYTKITRRLVIRWARWVVTRLPGASVGKGLSWFGRLRVEKG